MQATYDKYCHAWGTRMVWKATNLDGYGDYFHAYERARLFGRYGSVPTNNACSAEWSGRWWYKEPWPYVQKTKPTTTQRKLCIGGAIRDPLSGRSYVYCYAYFRCWQPISETRAGKYTNVILKTRLMVISYGNQILSGNDLRLWILHPGFVAKRMELVPRLVRLLRAMLAKPAGDVIILPVARLSHGVGGAIDLSRSNSWSL